jgi:hypothetical protein
MNALKKEHTIIHGFASFIKLKFGETDADELMTNQKQT